MANPAAADMIATAMSANVDTMASAQAGKQFNAQVKSSLKNPINMTTDEQAQLRRVLKMDVIHENTIQMTNEHRVIGACRMMARDKMSKYLNITPNQTTLFVGATSYELSQPNWYANFANHFSIHGSEVKDVSRIVPGQVKELIQRIKKNMTPADRQQLREEITEKPSNRVLKIRGLQKLLEAIRISDWTPLTKHDERIGMNIWPKVDRLIAFDSAYNWSEEDYFEAFDKTDATEMYSMLLLPEELIFTDVPENELYSLIHWKHNKITGSTTSVTKPDEDSWTSIEMRGAVGSHSGQYIHKWENWALPMRHQILTCKRRKYSIDIEIKDSFGPMKIVHFSRCQPKTPLFRSLRLPDDKEYVKIIDVTESYKADKNFTDLKYITVNAVYWWALAHYLSTLDDKSLNTISAMAFIRRSKAGISMAGTNHQEKWFINNDHLRKLAAACLMFVVVSRERMCEAMVAFDEKRKEPNWKRALDGLIWGAACILTLGAAIPISHLWKWMQYRKLEDKILVDVSDSVTSIYFPRYHSGEWNKTSEMLKNDIVFKADIAELAAEQSNDHGGTVDKNGRVTSLGSHPECPTCEATRQTLGPQLLKCDYQPGKQVTWSMTLDECMSYKNSIIEQAAAPECTGPLKAVLDAAKLRIPSRDISWTGTVEVIKAGPGCGKSKTIRDIFAVVENGLVASPFGKLREDYMAKADPETGVVTNTAFKTTHKAFDTAGKEIIFVDEYTAFDWRALMIILVSNPVKRLILCGDPLQTKLMENEGVYIGDKLEGEVITTHTLLTNFRNPQWPIAVLNSDYEYNMRAHSKEVGKPEFRPIAEGAGSPKGVTVMTFANTSAEYTCDQKANSVRSNQGGTFDHVGLIVTDRDRHLVNDARLFRVAISRHRKKLTIYVETGSEMEQLMRAKLHMDDEDFENSVGTLVDPDFREEMRIVDQSETGLTPEVWKILRNETSDETTDGATSDQSLEPNSTDSEKTIVQTKPRTRGLQARATISSSETETETRSKLHADFLKNITSRPLVTPNELKRDVTPDSGCPVSSESSRSVTPSSGDVSLDETVEEEGVQWCTRDAIAQKFPKEFVDRYTRHVLSKKTKYVKSSGLITNAAVQDFCRKEKVSLAVFDANYRRLWFADYSKGSGPTLGLKQHDGHSELVGDWIWEKKKFFHPEKGCVVCRPFELHDHIGDAQVRIGQWIDLSSERNLVVLNYEERPEEVPLLAQRIDITNLNTWIKGRSLATDQRILWDSIVGNTSMLDITTVGDVRGLLQYVGVDIEIIDQETYQVLLRSKAREGNTAVIVRDREWNFYMPEKDLDNDVKEITFLAKYVSRKKKDTTYTGSAYRVFNRLVEEDVLDDLVFFKEKVEETTPECSEVEETFFPGATGRWKVEDAMVPVPQPKELPVHQRLVMESMAVHVVPESYAPAPMEDLESRVVEKPLQPGYDAYLMGDTFSPIYAVDKLFLNEEGARTGLINIPRNGKFHPNLLNPVNVRGHPLNLERRAQLGRAMCIGEGLRYSANNNWQSAQAASWRYLRRRPVFRFNEQAKKLAHKIADTFVAERQNPVVIDPIKEADIVREWEIDSLKRQYEKRMIGEGEFNKRLIRYHLKTIFKPTKDFRVDPNSVIKDTLDTIKPGQGISAWSAEAVISFGALTRIVNHRWLSSLKEDTIYNNKYTEREIDDQLKNQKKFILPGAKTGVTDGKDFDSMQNRFTQEIERRHSHHLRVPQEVIDAYYTYRNDYPMIQNGLFKAVARSEKTSGEPGTLLFNSQLGGSVNNYVLRGMGPSAMAIQGDDAKKTQIGLHENTEALKDINRYSDFRLKTKIGNNQEFCGCVEIGGTLVPSVHRMYKKITAQTFKTEEHFYQYKMAILDKIRRIEDVGHGVVVAASASAVNVSYEEMDHLYDFVKSFSHLKWEQFKKVSIPIRDTTGTPNLIM